MGRMTSSDCSLLSWSAFAADGDQFIQGPVRLGESAAVNRSVHALWPLEKSTVRLVVKNPAAASGTSL